MKKQKVRGYIFTCIGSLLILINAIGYIFNLKISSPATSILGIIFVAIGTTLVKKS